MIVITGMHRSGTSMISNVLREVGVSFGDEDSFYATDGWNARGYFEQSEVMDLNCRLITGFRRNDASLLERLVYTARYATMPRPRRRPSCEHDLERMARRYAESAVKDPRFCITLGTWRAEARIDRCVVCLRHPAAVVASLWRRQRLPRPLGLRFWDFHLETLLEQLDGIETVYIDFDRLAGGECDDELERLRQAFAPSRTMTEMREIHGRVFDERLRHFEPIAAPLRPRTASIWEELGRRHRASAP